MNEEMGGKVDSKRREPEFDGDAPRAKDEKKERLKYLSPYPHLPFFPTRRVRDWSCHVP